MNLRPAIAGITVGLLTLIPAMAQQPESSENVSLPACDFETMEAFYLSRLGLSDIKIEYRFEDLSHPYHLGQARQLAPHKYLIILAPHLEPSELRITLAHELVHVRQFERGEIKQEEFRKDYLSRDHEDEAFRLSLPMARDFYLGHNCKK
ncbi:ImmA/IrrE family metallo-endopeptidase [Spongorhabdus nitratireducens]